MIINIISVIFNDAANIDSTIQSVLQQKQKRLDLKINYFVVDGGSHDGTLEILVKYDSNIDEWISEKDLGIYDAMNKALRMVNDGYILYLGAGDKIISLPTIQLLNSSVKAICGDVFTNENFVFKSNTSKGLRLGNSLHHQALLVHKSIFPNKAFNIEYKAYADYDLNIRLLKDGINFVYSTDLSAYQMPGGLTKSIYMSEMIEVVKCNFGLPSATLMMLYLLFAQVRDILINGKNNYTWERP